MKRSKIPASLLKAGLSIAVVLTNLGVSTVITKAEGSAFATVESDSLLIGNDAITREFSIEDGKVNTSKLLNHIGNTELLPQAGSNDFIINLLVPPVEDPNVGEDIVNEPDYSLGGLDTMINRSEWTATLQNSAGTQFTQTEVDKLFDNDLNTNVDNWQISGNPFYLDIDLQETTTFSSMSINKRPGFHEEAYGTNGTMGGYEILSRNDVNDEWVSIHIGEFTAEDYNLHKVGNLYNVGDTVYVNFDEVSARYVRVVQNSQAFGSANEFTSAELKLYAESLTTNYIEEVPTQPSNREKWSITGSDATGNIFTAEEMATLTDGDLDTHPNNMSVASYPINIDIDLGEKQQVSAISVNKRPGFTEEAYGTNGTMGEFDLYVSEDGINWSIAGAGNFTPAAWNLHKVGNLYNVGDTVYANFEKVYTTRYVRIQQKSAAFGSAQEFTSSEINIFADQYTGDNWNVEPSIQMNPSTIASSELTFESAKAKDIDNGKQLTIHFEPVTRGGVTYDIDQIFIVGNDDHYMRSFIEITPSDKDNARIDYIEQDRFILADDLEGVWSRPPINTVSSMWIGANELMLGQPIYANGFFMGSEFPATDTDITEGNKVQIRYYSGKNFTQLEADNQLTSDGKFVAWQNVVGVARSNDTNVVQTDFFAYIDEIATPTEFRKQYNSWYDNMMNITDESIAESFYGSELGLTENGVPPVDAYTVDDGWNAYHDEEGLTAPSNSAGTEPNKTGFWEFNEKFPNELYTSSALSNKLASTFGLWVGPQGGYNFFSTFARYLENMGTGFVQHGSVLGDVVCTGSRTYQENYKNLFIDYQNRFDISYWKWDGFANRPCQEEGHNHMVGGENNMYFNSDMWEGWTDVFEAVREAKGNEELFINATCYVNLSPWLLQWVNVVWIQDSGDTGEMGTGDRFEQKIYYRDEVYYKLLKQNQLQFPLKNLYNHDPIYGVSDGSHTTTEVFREFLIANAARGTAFWELYYSPSIFDDAKWRVNADVLAFAEENIDVLENAKMFGERPSVGAYGYSSWKGEEGIVSFTNPLDTEQTLRVTYDETIGVPTTLSHAQAIQVEPFVIQENEVVSYGDEVSVTLQPHETIIYHYNYEDPGTPVITSIKVTAWNEVTIKFNDRIGDKTTYTVDGMEVSAQLLEDYRTVVLTTKTPLTLHETITVSGTNLLNTANESSTFTTTATVYENETVVKVENKQQLVQDSENVSDVLQESTQIPFMKVNGEAQVDTNQAFEGKQDFSIEFGVKTDSVDQTLFAQGEDIQVRIDAEGYIEFIVGNKTVTSKEEVITVDEKAHGTFGTDQYVPTTTNTTLVGRVNDNVMHTVHAVREVNGLLKIYIDGVLVSSLYDETQLNEPLEKGVITIGDTNFTGYLSNVTLYNRATNYKEAEQFAKDYDVGVTTKVQDRTNWTATASSQMNNATGDGPASSAIDGNTATWWHSSYVDGVDYDVEDHYIEIDFHETISFDNFVYEGRGGSNGDLKEYSLEANINGTWTEIKTGTMDAAKTTIVNFDSTVSAEGLRLNWVTTQNGQSFGAAVEIYVTSNKEALAEESDVKDLNDAIVAINPAKYTLVSAQKYIDIANEIKNLESINATQSIIDELREQLLNAYNELVLMSSTPEYATIKNALEEALVLKIDATGYTASSYAIYLNAYTEAEKAMANPEALLSDLTNAKSTLEAAKAGLIILEAPLGDKMSVTRGERIIIKSSAAYETFTSLVINGKVVEDTNYHVTAGSIVVELTDTYIASLANGSHEVVINSTDGNITVQLTIVESNDPTTPTTPSDPTNPTESPNTGDTTNTGLYIGLCIIGLLGLGFGLFRKMKK